MGIRDVLMLVLGYGCVPLALYSAYYGLLAYCWLSFMRPQSLVWSQAVQSARITLVIGAVLIGRALLTAGPKVRLRRPTALFLGLWAWFGVCTLTSTHAELSWEELIKFSKVGVAVVLITGLVRTRGQLKWLMLLLAACPGIWAVKFGLYFARTGGGMSESGGPIGMDNNDTAMFIALSIPLLVLVGSTVAGKWWRRGLYAAGALAVPGVMLTGSRGGLLAMALAGGLAVWRKTTWWKAVLVGAAGLAVGLAIMPRQQEQRYETIESYEQDTSAMGRIWAWQVSLAMAADRPITGVGFGQDAYLREYEHYQTVQGDFPHAAHSVWFSLIGETGYVGLGLYVSLIVSVLMSTRRVMRGATRAGRGRNWAWNYAAALQCAVLTFALAGTFLSQARFEFIFALCMVAVPLAHLAEAEAYPGAAKIRAARKASGAATAVATAGKSNG